MDVQKKLHTSSHDDKWQVVVVYKAWATPKGDKKMWNLQASENFENLSECKNHSQIQVITSHDSKAPDNGMCPTMVAHRHVEEVLKFMTKPVFLESIFAAHESLVLGLVKSVGWVCLWGVCLCKKIRSMNRCHVVPTGVEAGQCNSCVAFYWAKGKLRKIQCDGWRPAMVLKSAELALQLWMSFAILFLISKAHSASWNESPQCTLLWLLAITGSHPVHWAGPAPCHRVGRKYNPSDQTDSSYCDPTIASLESLDWSFMCHGDPTSSALVFRLVRGKWCRGLTNMRTPLMAPSYNLDKL